MDSAVSEPNTEEYNDAKDRFKRHFDTVVSSAEALKRLRDAQDRSNAGKESSVRFIIDMERLQRDDAALARELLEKPLSYQRAALEALRLSCEENYGTAEIEHLDLFVGVAGPFGDHLVSPRGLKSHLLGHMVSVEGIVTKMGMVKPKLVDLVQYCPTTQKEKKTHYRDGTALDGPPTSTIIPTRDEKNHVLEMEFGHSKYRDYQKFTIQEMPERAPLGQLPRSIEVICEDDLVDLVKPGDRVQCTGIFRALGMRSIQEVTGMFKTVVLCNNVVKLGGDTVGLNDLTAKDVENINEVAGQPDVFEKMAKSLAPSIYGHEFVKKAVLLLLLGGVEKILENGTHLRGDINVLIVGDPSTAKSQMLRFVLGIAPLAISTTGRGSTGVGLTAAVTTDPDTGERRLEAGAMVLADRGVVLIDEFDKMGDGDRVAIHEVMEQQTVTIAKAGIHASLNARCSVVAAANPIYGQYNKDLSPQRNIGLPDSLLSRFDLLFVVLDNSSADNDRAVSEHVLRIHRYQEPGREGKPIPLDAPSNNSLAPHLRKGQQDDNDDDDDNPEKRDGTSEIFQKFNPILHPQYARTQQLFSTGFIRKFIYAAKKRIQPVLTEEARQIISEEYAELRGEQATKTLPITPRCLETLIRLSTAHAKCRFSKEVQRIDVEAAREILRFALYNDTERAEERRRQKEKEEAKKRAAAQGEDDDDDDDDESELDGDELDEDDIAQNDNDNERKGSGRQRSRKRQQLESKEPEEDTIVPDEEERLAVFRKAMADAFLANKKDEFVFDELLTLINEAVRKLKGESEPYARWPMYARPEAEKILGKLEDDNIVLFRDNEIWKV